MWEEVIFFRAASGTEYELVLRCHDKIPPKRIEEGPDGGISETDGDGLWNGLTEMTNDLKVEIVSWGSDVGD